MFAMVTMSSSLGVLVVWWVIRSNTSLSNLKKICQIELEISLWHRNYFCLCHLETRSQLPWLPCLIYFEFWSYGKISCLSILWQMWMKSNETIWIYIALSTIWFVKWREQHVRGFLLKRGNIKEETDMSVDCFTLLLARHLADVSCYIGPSMPNGICMEIYTKIVQKRKKKQSPNEGIPRENSRLFINFRSTNHKAC